MTDRLDDAALARARRLASLGAPTEPIQLTCGELLALLDEVAEHRALPVEWGFRTEGYAHGPVVCADREDAEAWVAKARKHGGISRHLVTRTGPGQWRPA